MRRSLLVLSTLLLTACPDPRATGGGTTSSSADGASGGEAGPGDAPSDPGGEVILPKFSDHGTPSLELSGTFTIADEGEGSNRIDFNRVSAGGQVELLHAMTLESPGEWSVEAPAGLGPVVVVAFVDADGMGPDASEPTAWTVIEVDDEDVSDVALSLEITADNPFLRDADPELLTQAVDELRERAPADGAPPPQDPAAEGGSGDAGAGEGEALPPDGAEGGPADAGAADEGSPTEGSGTDATPADGPQDDAQPTATEGDAPTE